MAMEATPVDRPAYQATDLLGPDFAVPTNAPKAHTSQPRESSDNRTKQLLKYIPRISLRSVRSSDSTSEIMQSNTTNGKRHGPRQPQSGNSDGALAHLHSQLPIGDTCATTREESQQNTDRPDFNHDEVRIPMLKLLFSKMMRTQKMPHITEIPLRERSSSILNTRAQSTHVVNGDNTSPGALHPSPVVNAIRVPDPAPSVRSQATIASHESAVMSGALPVDIASPSERTPGLNSSPNQAHESPAPVTTEPHIPAMQTFEVIQPRETGKDQIAKTKDRKIDTVDENVDSTNIYSPEQGIFVGKLRELPPPEELQLEWRQKIRPQLVKNLMTVIGSLSQSLTRSETTIEPELLMSGVSHHGHLTVTLKPTIWIRCGSKPCRKAVQQVVADLSNIQRFPVHVTLHAPRPASAGKPATSPPRVSDPSAVDEISPMEPNPSISRPATNPNMPDHTPLITLNDLSIRVQSLVDNHLSACGLRIQFSYPNGAKYTCTLGGLVLLDDEVVGLTTAHAMFDYGLGPDALEPIRKTHTHDLCSDGPSGECMINFPPLKASLRAANFGKCYFPSRPESVNAFSKNHDFALLHLHPERSVMGLNVYRPIQGGQLFVDTISQDLTGRVVHILCSYGDVKPGQLIDGDSILMDKTGYWDTKKLQLDTPLATGSSGTWVVEGRALLGAITSVYDNEPYAHMIPIASIFLGIESVFNTESKRTRVKMIGFGHLDSRRQDVEGNEATSQRLIKEQAQLEKHRLYPHLESLWPIFLMVLVIGLDASAYPVILPDVADTINSTDFIGFLGSVYLLAFGLTYPILIRLHTLLADLSNYRALIFLRLASITIFAAGSVLSYCLTTIQGAMVGRAIAGMGAASTLSGITTLLEVYISGTNQRLGVFFLMVHSAARLVGPIIAAAMMEDLGLHPAWRSFFLLLIITTAVAFFLTVVCLIRKWKAFSSRLQRQHPVKPKEVLWLQVPPRQHPLDPTKKAWFKVLLRLNFHTFICGGIAMMSLQFALYFGTTQGSDSSTSIALFTAGFVVPSGVFILLQFKKHVALVPQALSIDQLVQGMYIALWGISFYSFSYFTPIWIRTIRNKSPMMTGMMYLPLAATHVFACIILLPFIFRGAKRVRDEEDRDKAIHSSTSIAQAPQNDTEHPEQSFPGPHTHATTFEGDVNSPSSILVVSLSIMALSAGLSSRFNGSTSLATVLGLQTLFSVGAGLGASQFALFSLDRSSVLSPPASTSQEKNTIQHVLPMFAEMVGGSIGTAAAQAICTSLLKRGELERVGPTDVREKSNGEAVETVNGAMTRTFFVATVAGALPVGITVALGAAIVAIAVTPVGGCIAAFFWRRARKNALRGVQGK